MTTATITNTKFTTIKISVDSRNGYKVRAENPVTGDFYTTRFSGEFIALDRALSIAQELMQIEVA